MRKLTVLAALVLAGCTSFSVLDEELPKYNGKPIDALVAKLGYPNAEQTTMGHKATAYQSESIVPSYTTGYTSSRARDTTPTTARVSAIPIG